MNDESRARMSPCLQIFIESLLQGADEPNVGNVRASFVSERRLTDANTLDSRETLPSDSGRKWSQIA